MSSAIPKHNSTGFFWGTVAVLLILSWIVKFEGPSWVHELYHSGHFSVLEFLTGRQDDSLAYYRGRVGEIWLGPVSQLLSGIAFLLVALRYLKDTTAFRFGAAVFAYLVLAKFEVLFFPPYGDAIGGPFAEAIWLYRHHFDYAALFAQPTYNAGGPKVYMFSVFPTYLALGMAALPNVKAFLAVNHLVFFMMGAAIASVLREVSRRVFSPENSVLLSLVLVFTPLFQAQVEAINMELPSVFFTVLAAGALIQNRIHRAGILTVVAVMVKGSAISACGAFVAVAVLRRLGVFGRTNPGENFRSILWSIILVAFSLLQLSLKYVMKDQHIAGDMVRLFAGWPSVKTFFISYVFLAATALAGVHWWRMFRDKGEPLFKYPQWYPVCVMLIYGWSWFLLFLNFYAVSDRYRLMVYPFLIFGCFFAFQSIVPVERVRRIALAAVAVICLISSYGLLYEPLIYNNHVGLERSLEYRSHLRLQQDTAETIEDKYSQYLIAAPFITAQTLALPELGFVKKPLDVMIYGFPCTYGGIKKYRGIEFLDLSRTVFVGEDYEMLAGGQPYPIDPKDTIIEQIQVGNKRIWLFQGGLAIYKVYRVNQLRGRPD